MVVIVKIKKSANTVLLSQFEASCFCCAAHQRKLLLAAATSGSSTKCVSHDARRPTFVCTHAGPDTYLGQREVPMFNFPTSNRAKTEQVSVLLQQQQLISIKMYQVHHSSSRNKTIRSAAPAAAVAAAQQQCRSGNTATATYSSRLSIRIRLLSLSRSVRTRAEQYCNPFSGERGNMCQCTGQKNFLKLFAAVHFFFFADYLCLMRVIAFSPKAERSIYHGWVPSLW